MMMHKVEVRPNKPRDGRHCDLCGCSQPAVRCDKCGCQIFCLSCDDMYHRHPKRRFHLRKAVDPTPPTTQARPVLPVKVSHLPTSPGDPSKMPLPPPRKKKPVKAFFDTFRKQSPSPSSDNSPPLPRKEYSWTDRLGSIKKFMSNRPLPPLPSEDFEKNHEDFSNTSNHNLSFIHKKVEEKPPQLPERNYKPQDMAENMNDKENMQRRFHGHGHHHEELQNGVANGNHVEALNGHDGNPWPQRMMGNQMPHHMNTMNRQNHFQHGSSGYPPGMPQTMHQSASATDLQNLPGMEGFPRPGMPPHYPPYPMNPAVPSPYPYPMYPQYPNYQPYFGNSFANLSSHPPTTDGDFSDHSESSSRHPSSKRYSFQKKAKRSQSVMVDRMGYPGQFYPFGPYPPGYAPQPWSPPYQMGTPPSPASSIRSLNRIGRSRRRRKATSDDDDDFSMSSSPLSRPKSSSSERPTQALRKAPLATQSSSFEESEEEIENVRHRERKSRKHSDPKRMPSPAARSPQIAPVSKSPQTAPAAKSPPISKKKSSKVKKKEYSPHHEFEEPETNIIQSENQISKGVTDSPQPSSSTVLSSDWQCKHCTFLNSSDSKICQVCYKTATPVDDAPAVLNDHQLLQDISRRQTVSPEEIHGRSPETKQASKVRDDEDPNATKDKQDMENLNSALDEAEKEITRGLEELMKLKEDFDSPQQIEPKNKTITSQKPPAGKENSESSKPVYKSSGKMRPNILDKLSFKASETTTRSASTDTQTSTSLDASNSQNDRIIEARRASTSSASDAYNSPIAQSPELESPPSKQNQVRKDSSCQTQQDELIDYMERKKFEEDSYFGRSNTGFGYRYGDRMDMVTSPVPSMYDRGFAPGYGMMNRSHSRASLFTGRLNDPGPMDFVPTPMYRSVSRSSLTGDFPEGRFSEFHNLRKPDYYLSMEELVERRRQEQIRAQGLELVRMIREAEQQGFTADDIQVALSKSGKQNPLEWLHENWGNMVENVVNLSTNYGNDKKENDIGAVSEQEARDALRMHKGNIWAAVTECVESRQRKFFELKARGKFSSRAITEALTATQGDVGLAYENLAKNNTKSSKPFLMRIWGAGEGAENQDGALRSPSNESLQSAENIYRRKNNYDYDVLSDDIWTEDEDVDWDEDGDEADEPTQGDIDDLQTCREDLAADALTPESDKSDYCDAFGTNTLDRMSSLPSDEEFYIIPDVQKEKKRSNLISKLAGLRKTDKPAGSENYDKDISGKTGNKTAQESSIQSDQPKSLAPMNIIKSTISAIRDTMSGTVKSEKNQPNVAVERRTIIVGDKINNEKQQTKQKSSSPVRLMSIKHISENESVLTSKERVDDQCDKQNSESSSDILKFPVKNNEILHSKLVDNSESQALESEKSSKSKLKSPSAQEKSDNNSASTSEKLSSKTDTVKTSISSSEKAAFKDKISEHKIASVKDVKLDSTKEIPINNKSEPKTSISIDTKKTDTGIRKSDPVSLPKGKIDEVSTTLNTTEDITAELNQSQKDKRISVNESQNDTTLRKNESGREIISDNKAKVEMQTNPKKEINKNLKKLVDKAVEETSSKIDNVIGNFNDLKKTDSKELKESNLKNNNVIGSLPNSNKVDNKKFNESEFINDGAISSLPDSNANKITESKQNNLKKDVVIDNLPDSKKIENKDSRENKLKIESITSDKNIKTSDGASQPKTNDQDEKLMNDRDINLHKEVKPFSKNEKREKTPENRLQNNEQVQNNRVDDIEFIDSNTVSDENIEGTSTNKIEPSPNLSESQTTDSKDNEVLAIKNEFSNLDLNISASKTSGNDIKEQKTPLDKVVINSGIEINYSSTKQDVVVQNYPQSGSSDIPVNAVETLNPHKQKPMEKPFQNQMAAEIASPETLGENSQLQYSEVAPINSKIKSPLLLSKQHVLESDEKSARSLNNTQSSTNIVEESGISMNSNETEKLKSPNIKKEKEFIKEESQRDSKDTQTLVVCKQNKQINIEENSSFLTKREQTDLSGSLEHVNSNLPMEQKNLTMSNIILNDQNLLEANLENIQTTSPDIQEPREIYTLYSKESSTTENQDESYPSTTLKTNDVVNNIKKILKDDYTFHEPVSSKTEKIANSKLNYIQPIDFKIPHTETAKSINNLIENSSKNSKNSLIDSPTSFSHSAHGQTTFDSTNELLIGTKEHVKSSSNDRITSTKSSTNELNSAHEEDISHEHSKESVSLNKALENRDNLAEGVNDFNENQEISKNDLLPKDIKSNTNKESVSLDNNFESLNSTKDINQSSQAKQEVNQSSISKDNSVSKSNNLADSNNSHITIPSSSTDSFNTNADVKPSQSVADSKNIEKQDGETNELNVPLTSTSNDQIPLQVSTSSEMITGAKKSEIKKHGILKRTPSTEGHAANKVSFSAENIEIAQEIEPQNESSPVPSTPIDETTQENPDENDSQNESVSLSSSNTSSRRSSVTSITPPSPVDALRNRFEGMIDDGSAVVRPHSPFRRMSFNSRKAAIALERTRDSSADKSWISQKPKYEPPKPAIKRTLKQQLEVERKIRKLVSDRKCRTYKKAEIIIQLMDMNFEEEEAIQAANECATLEQAISYLQQECLLCTGYFPVSHIISMVHCPHMACRECIRAYFTVQIRDRNIMELLCPFCNEPDLTDEDIAQDYFNHLDIMLKKLVDEDIHELFQRKLRDRVLMRDPCFRWCSKCSSGFIAMPNLKQLICPDCNAVTCASCRRPWEREHQGISCEAFAAWKDATDPEAQTLGLAKLLTEDGIDCPRCHFRYALAKGGCMHFRCIQCQHDFCSGCSRPFKMGQKCGVSEFCAKLGLHAHHPRNCLFYLRDKEPEDLQRLLDLSDVKYDKDPPEGMEVQTTCQVMEQKETADGMVDDYCGKDVENNFAGLCRIHYVEYLGQLVNKHKVDPIQIFENDDLELVLRRANVRLPPKRYRETDVQYREKLVNLIQEELPLDKMDGS